MNFPELRRRAAIVRAVPLEAVLLFRGAARDGRDRRKWHTEQGPLSVSGPKFMNWQRGEGGGGAIDLVMHLAGVGFREALAWLEQHMAAVPAQGREPASPAASKEGTVAENGDVLRLPAPDERVLGRVRFYLTGCRGLAASLIESLIQAGRLYGDRRGNAVFVLVSGRRSGRSARSCGAPARGFGGEWRPAPARTWDTSGSVPRVPGKSSSASPRSMPSVASKCFLSGSASPPRAFAPTLPGSMGCLPEVTNSTAASMLTAPAMPQPTQ